MIKKDLEIEFKKFDRNIEDLEFPFLTIKICDSEKIINLPVQLLRKFSINYENIEGKRLKVEKRTGRKYTRYFIDLRQFNLPDYKEWEIKQLQEIK